MRVLWKKKYTLEAIRGQKREKEFIIVFWTQKREH